MYPITGDKVQISLYLNEPDCYDSMIIKKSSDLGGTTYTDTALDQPIWLCPWLQGYFGFVPKKMYIKIQVIDK